MKLVSIIIYLINHCVHLLSFVDRYTANLTIFDTLETTYTLAIGSTVEFTCLATANDVTNLDFFYRKIDGTLADNIDRTAIDGTDIDTRTTMRINGVTEQNAGEYECVVRDLDAGGSAHRLDGRTFSINVLGKLYIIIKRFTSTGGVC